MQARAISVDSIVVDYANLQTNSFTPVVFTLRNTGTTVLDAATVAVGGYSASVTSLNPGDSTSVTVLYKTGDTIANPTYTITTGGSPLASGMLHLDYNDIGISSMKVVEESQGKRTVLVTLYNDSAAKLAGSGRTVELRFYSDSEHSQPASVTLVGSQSGVTCTGNTITLTGSALSRLDQGSMALLVTYDLASYVTGTLQQEEVPASGVYLYANALVKENGKTMAEHAQGNNSTGVQLTGAYARTGEETTLDAALDNSGAATTADVTLQNNCLQPQPDKGTLLAVLLDENGNALETKAVTENTGLSCEETKQIQVTFGQKGSDVILLYAPANSTGLQLRFTNMNVGLSDFVEDPANPNVQRVHLHLARQCPGLHVRDFRQRRCGNSQRRGTGEQRQRGSCHPHRHQHHHGGVRRENLQPHLEPDRWHRRQSRRWRWVSHPAHLPAQHSGDGTWHRNGQPRPAPSGR